MIYAVKTEKKAVKAFSTLEAAYDYINSHKSKGYFIESINF